MNLDNPVIQLCVESTQAEFRGEIEQAKSFVQKAWDLAQDNFEACVAAHYVARYQENDHERLVWNQIALDKANACPDEPIKVFYPSLYLNMGQSYENLGNLIEAKRYYDLAADLGANHQVDYSCGSTTK